MGQAGAHNLSVPNRLYSLDLSMEAVSPARSARQGRKPQLQSVKLVPSVKRSRRSAKFSRVLHIPPGHS
jgi:hypothetical protein